jgi:plasmid stabilization system protein ParE
MEMIVLWSDSAIEDLQEIHDYFIAKASFKIANKITNSIVDKTISLENNPRIGQAEELLKHKKEEIRYLVDCNYKIVYFIDKNYVIIATVFDCRQDPKKLETKNM